MDREEYDQLCVEVLDRYQVPEVCRERAIALAWELGHSSGYQEVLNYLDDIAMVFEPLNEGSVDA